MASVVIEQIPVLSDNYVYLVHEPQSGATAAVDPAVPEPVLERLESRGWRLSHILNTHHHGDHTGANLELVKRTGCAVIGAARDCERIPGITQEVGARDTIMVGAASARVLEVPGHTSGHIAFWFADSHALFCGDTLFSLGCGRLFEGTAEQMWASLQQLRELPADTSVYCAHEYTASNARFAKLLERDNAALAERVAEVEHLRAKGLATIPVRLEIERATNPFLRADQDSVARAVGMEPGADPAQVFAEIRRRKDAF
jgi:hydroxyacylglutathione hydrolase